MWQLRAAHIWCWLALFSMTTLFAILFDDVAYGMLLFVLALQLSPRRERVAGKTYS
jgi:vacuolar-type H+-ATPase subunit I/STV1